MICSVRSDRTRSGGPSTLTSISGGVTVPRATPTSCPGTLTKTRRKVDGARIEVDVVDLAAAEIELDGPEVVRLHLVEDRARSAHGDVHDRRKRRQEDTVRALRGRRGDDVDRKVSLRILRAVN